jgi:hypothetical protein
VRERAGGGRLRIWVLARLLLGWVGRARGISAALAAVITIVVASGCQTSAERSAELQRAAKHELLASRGVSVSKQSADVKVLYSTIVRSKEGAAVVVGLRDTSSHMLENAPIEITVHDAKGGLLYQNNQPGLDPALTHVSVLAPGAVTVWVDDQVQVSGVPASASALVGEARKAESVPALSVVGAHLVEEAGAGAGVSGTVTNQSNVSQQHLVVYVVARKGDRIVAAGRAVLPEVAPRAGLPFQAFFVGDPSGAKIEASAPATTF